MMKITNGAKVHQLRETKDYGHYIDVTLHDHETTKDIYWSPVWAAPPDRGGRGGLNSYLVFADVHGEIGIASVNGAGEIRWTIPEWQAKYAFRCEQKFPNSPPWAGDWVEQLGVLKHFGVVIEENDE